MADKPIIMSETLFEMRRRHKQERLALMLSVIRAHEGRVPKAAMVLGVGKGEVYRELREAGVGLPIGEMKALASHEAE